MIYKNVEFDEVMELVDNGKPIFIGVVDGDASSQAIVGIRLAKNEKFKLNQLRSTSWFVNGDDYNEVFAIPATPLTPAEKVEDDGHDTEHPILEDDEQGGGEL